MFTIPQSLSEEVSDIEAQGLREVRIFLLDLSIHFLGGQHFDD